MKYKDSLIIVQYGHQKIVINIFIVLILYHNTIEHSCFVNTVRWLVIQMRNIVKVFVIYFSIFHYNDVIMSAMASQITSVSIVYLTVYSGADQRKHQSSASLAIVRGIPQWPVNSPHKTNAENVSIWWRHHVIKLSVWLFRWVHSIHCHRGSNDADS